MKLYGIKNCSSVKKAMVALEDKNLSFEFVDIKKLDEKTLNFWLEQKSFEELINTAGLSAKKLGLNKEKVKSKTPAELKICVLENPTLIKRPVVKKDQKIYIGKEYEALL